MKVVALTKQIFHFHFCSSQLSLAFLHGNIQSGTGKLLWSLLYLRVISCTMKMPSMYTVVIAPGDSLW